MNGDRRCLRNQSLAYTNEGSGRHACAELRRLGARVCDPQQLRSPDIFESIRGAWCSDVLRLAEPRAGAEMNRLQILVADQLDAAPCDLRFHARADQGVELVLEPIHGRV